MGGQADVGRVEEGCRGSLYMYVFLFSLSIFYLFIFLSFFFLLVLWYGVLACAQVEEEPGSLVPCVPISSFFFLSFFLWDMGG
jgi:hypothetical protein